MRKASKILCLIGGIVGILLALLWLALAIVWFVRAGMFIAAKPTDDISAWTEEFRRWFIEWVQENYYTSWDECISAAIGQGAKYLVMMLFCIPSAIISFILSKKEKTGLPLPIVLAVLSWAGNLPAFVGAGLAIVNWAVVERKEGQQAEEPKAE